jgi:hypothetical protein
MDLVVGANSKGIGSYFSALFVVNAGTQSTVFMAIWSGFKDNVPSSRHSWWGWTLLPILPPIGQLMAS